MWRVRDSNPRMLSSLIYSQIPLAAWVTRRRTRPSSAHNRGPVKETHGMACREIRARRTACARPELHPGRARRARRAPPEPDAAASGCAPPGHLCRVVLVASIRGVRRGARDGRRRRATRRTRAERGHAPSGDLGIGRGQLSGGAAPGTEHDVVDVMRGRGGAGRNRNRGRELPAHAPLVPASGRPFC